MIALKDFLTFQNYCFQCSSTNYFDHIRELESSNYDCLKYGYRKKPVLSSCVMLFYLLAEIQRKSERITGVASDWIDFKAAISRIQFPQSM